MPDIAGVTVTAGAPKLFPPVGASQIVTVPLICAAGALKLFIVNEYASKTSLVKVYVASSKVELAGTAIVAGVDACETVVPIHPGRFVQAPPLILY